MSTNNNEDQIIEEGVVMTPDTPEFQGEGQVEFDPMMQTGEALFGGQEGENPENVKENEQKEETTEEEEQLVTEEKGGPDEVDELDQFEDGAAIAGYLQESGLSIYNELDPNLTVEQFAQDLTEFVPDAISRGIEKKWEQEKATMGSFADYYELHKNGIPAESLNPAIEVEKFASFDIDNIDNTNTDLSNLVTQMLTRQGMDPELVQTTVEALEANPDKLRSQAEKSVNFHKEFIESVKQEAVNRFQYDQQKKESEQQEEHEQFVNVLNNSEGYSKQEKQDLYDIRYKRNQIITYQDDNGVEKQDYVTKYDILQYNIENNPEYLVSMLKYMDQISKGNTAANSGITIKNNTAEKYLNRFSKKQPKKITKQVQSPEENISIDRNSFSKNLQGDSSYAVKEY